MDDQRTEGMAFSSALDAIMAHLRWHTRPWKKWWPDLQKKKNIYICMFAMSWDFSPPSHNSLTFSFSLLHFCFNYFPLTNNVYS